MDDSVIRVENVWKTFHSADTDKVGALENVSLDIRQGEFVTVVGPSGCGKSTLIKLIAGLVAMSSGRIVCQGKDVRGLNAKVGYVPQESKLFPWLTVEQNVAFGLDCKPYSQNAPIACATSFNSPGWLDSRSVTQRSSPAVWPRARQGGRLE
jgi:ABC-type nitrate/sulfonate/bicarbonate transport system ATPase subunit